jgi:hypothetical protein
MNTFKVRNINSKKIQKNTNMKYPISKINKQKAQILLQIAQKQDNIKMLTKQLKNLNK